MTLYYITNKKNLYSVMKDGILPDKDGKIHLTSNHKLFELKKNDIILEINTKEIPITCFDDCNEKDILCWGKIEPENINKIL